MATSNTDFQIDSEKQYEDMSGDVFMSQSEDEPKQVTASTKEQLEPQYVENNSLEQWNSPSINKYRYLAANFGFIIMGMNDAAYGVSWERFLYRDENEVTD